jgi:hypothetical protein
MLKTIDRLQQVCAEANETSERWISLLGAEVSGKDQVKPFAAKRTTLRLGSGFIELLTPNGEGAVADAYRARGAHMFSAGASAPDLSALVAHLQEQNITPLQDGSNYYLEGEELQIPGLRLVLSDYEARPCIGDIDYLYEATLLAQQPKKLTQRFAEVFGLNADSFVTIDSPRFGYNGTLTLFEAEELHRFEVIEPIDPNNTMGRFFGKKGPTMYMSFAETRNLYDIEQRVLSTGLGQTIDRPAERADSISADQIWLHPATLGGVMLGLSRPSMAWSWSGSPERVEPLS